MRQFFKEIYYFGNRVAKDNIPVYAAYGTLFIILSIFPFIMLLLSITQYLPITKEFMADELSGSALMPEVVSPLLQTIVADLTISSSSTLLSVTAVVTLWSASKGVYGIFKGMNSVYHSSEQRNYFWIRAMCLFYTLVFYVIVIITMVLMVFGEQLQDLLLEQLTWLRRFDNLISFLRLLISILFQTYFFMLIYKVFPDRKATIWSQIPGALVSSVGWMLFSYAFSIYMKYFSNYSKMYGSLTAIILTILWLYVCISIILFGGELNAWLEESDPSEL
ncbi:MAG: YihY/virulence factor BrkB family protein [Lachnospiraceae bacterium]|nr:YihY/virulence factor BrkB family protein [Lachnospiraceae bacterium]